MSKHITTVPVDIRAVIDALPADSFVHSVALRDDKSGVDIIWDSPSIKTKYTFPVDYPLSKLNVKSLDTKVKGRK